MGDGFLERLGSQSLTYIIEGRSPSRQRHGGFAFYRYLNGTCTIKIYYRSNEITN